MIYESNDFGVGGNVNFTNHHSESENCLLIICIQMNLVYGAFFLRHKQIYDEKLPLMKIQKTSEKIKKIVIQLLIIRDIQNLPLDIFFWWWRKGWNKLKKYVSPKLSKSKMAANYG